MSPPQRRNLPAMKDCLLFQTAKVDFFINHAGKKSSFQRAMKTDEVRDRPLDSFGGRLPCCLNCIGSFLVTGRDASLPAPLLGAFCILVARGTVGALPQTPQGTLSLDPARGKRKGTKSPLDPFSRLSWSLFLTSSACCSDFPLSIPIQNRAVCVLPQTARFILYYHQRI